MCLLENRQPNYGTDRCVMGLRNTNAMPPDVEMGQRALDGHVPRLDQFCTSCVSSLISP